MASADADKAATAAIFFMFVSRLTCSWRLAVILRPAVDSCSSLRMFPSAHCRRKRKRSRPGGSEGKIRTDGQAPDRQQFPGSEGDGVRRGEPA